MANLDLTAQIMSVLKEYNGTVTEAVQEILPKVAKEGQKMLRQVSPSKTGKYASGWSVKTEKGTMTIDSIIYNRKAPGLPHLLEKGHAKRNGGRTGARVHIAPVEEWVKSEVVKQLEEAISR